MKRKWLWLFISGLVGAALVLVSCAPAEEEEVAEEEEEGVGPTYGGGIIIVMKTNVQGFDVGQGARAAEPGRIANETLVEPMWEKGPAGTHEVDWEYASRGLVTFLGPSIAESWEVPEPGTAVFQIRKGVHWALDPNSEASKLVGGRELTADDIVYNYEYTRTNPKSSVVMVEPELCENTTITKTGPWEVTMTFPPISSAGFWKKFPMTDSPLMAPEVIKEYGDQNEWDRVVGTGAYMLTGYVDGASATMTRNPNYWRKDPCGPGKGNKLPYVETLKYLIIPDISTQTAAIRTAKADWIADVTPEDAKTLLNSNPDLKSVKYSSKDAGCLINVDNANPELPTADKRVRQALMLATDQKQLMDVYYAGEADLLTWPIAPIKGENYPYVPLEEMPQSVQELFEYKPEKAKQLLEDAGYAGGFTAEVIAQGIPTHIDVLSAVADMWSKVNVTMDIQPREYAVWRSLRHEYNNMYFSQGQSVDIWTDGANIRGKAANYSHIDDPMVWDVYEEIGDYIIIDENRAVEKLKGLNAHLLEESYLIQLPRPWGYTIWWPWIMNYHGERGIMPNTDAGWVKYVWIDQDMKDELLK